MSRFLAIGVLSLLMPLLATAEPTDKKLTDKDKVAAAVLANEAANNAENQKANKTATDNAPKLKLAKIEVSGVDSELKKNIELHMPVSIPTCTAERGEIRQFFTTVKKNLRKASRALGYYDAEFRSGGSIVDRCWKLRLRITPGLPTKIFSQNIKVIGEGRNDEVFKKILTEFPYKKGEVFNHQKYSDFKTKLSEATQSLGYFDAEFEKHTVAVNPLAHKASINLVLNTGTRYRYGEVRIDQKVLSDTTIKNFLILKEGGLYKTEDLIKQQQLLQRSGYYKLIKVEVLRDEIKNNRVPVLITLNAKKRNAYKLKMGYGSDTGVRVSAEMDRRWTGSKGKKLKAKVQYSENLSGISLRLVSPRKNPEDDILVYNIDWEQDTTNDLTGKSVNIGGKYTRKRSNDWVQSASIGLLLESTQVDQSERTRSKYLIFGVGLEKLKADNLLYPDEGWRLKVGLKGTTKSLLSDQNILQLEGSAKYITRLNKGRLISRIQAGSTKVKDFKDFPKSLRFFAGGGNSVRGYRFDSLGEIDENDKVVGGKHRLDLSLEYQHPVSDEWSAAIFVDAGNAFDDIHKPDLKIGAGFGARWRSPIGPVRIDLGFPKGDERHPTLHLSVGSDL